MLDPPLVLIALHRSSNLLRHLSSSGRFGVNVLAANQQQIGIACGRSALNKLAGVLWHDEDELPRIDGTAAWIACDVHTVMPGGDHIIVLGLVTRCDRGEPEALIVHQRGFRRLRASRRATESSRSHRPDSTGAVPLDLLEEAALDVP